MRLHRRLRPTLITAAAGVACLAFATPAVAADDPHGNNGTVKIDGAPFEDSVDNQPHVTCDFEVEFFGFDEGQTADITLAGQPPSSAEFLTVKTLDDVEISHLPAGGAANDHDHVLKFSANELDLSKLELHSEQGYHIKLTVESDAIPGGSKSKVFWLKPCPPQGTPSSSPPTSPGNPPPSSPGGNGGGSNGGGSLPITGVAAGGIALAGVALVGGGVALLVLRRRRDDVTFTA